MRIILALAFLTSTGIALTQQDAAAHYRAELTEQRKATDAKANETLEWRKAAKANAMSAYKQEGRLADCWGRKEL